MKKIILTCEHGGAEIPRVYKKIFKNHASVLKTHRGLDLGALGIAKQLQKNLQSPLYFSVISRLLVDLNRFLTSTTLWSEFTKDLSQSEKQKILAKYYLPHWNKVQKRILALAKLRIRVFHIAVHSMTDRLDDDVRKMQLALLYDPRRTQEKKLVKIWMQELRKEFPGFLIAQNKPYHGAGEGLTSALRVQIEDQYYVGIELEMNQGYLKLLSSRQAKTAFSESLSQSLTRAIAQIE